MNSSIVPLVLAALGAIAALANGGGPFDAILGAAVMYLIGYVIVWAIAKAKGEQTTEKS